MQCVAQNSPFPSAASGCGRLTAVAPNTVACLLVRSGKWRPSPSNRSLEGTDDRQLKLTLNYMGVRQLLTIGGKVQHTSHKPGQKAIVNGHCSTGQYTNQLGVHAVVEGDVQEGQRRTPRLGLRPFIAADWISDV